MSAQSANIRTDNQTAEMNASPNVEVLSALLGTARLLENHGNPEIAAAASREAVELQKRLAAVREEEARQARHPKAA
jgi:hypothetical protein